MGIPGSVVVTGDTAVSQTVLTFYEGKKDNKKINRPTRHTTNGGCFMSGTQG